MRRETARLVDHIKERPEKLITPRAEANYDAFLGLYRDIGYAPSDLGEISLWEERSRSTWRMLDSLLPGNCTGGAHGDAIVSSWGTLPVAEKVLYGHSVCMTKTLESAATMFAQSLLSLKTFESSTEMGYYAGSYAHRSRFTSLLQRPVSGPIGGQIEIEAVEVYPRTKNGENHADFITAEAVTEADLALLSPALRCFFEEMSRPCLLLEPVHKARGFAIRDFSSGAVTCLALVHKSESEFTAANVFSRTWLFMAPGVTVSPELFDGIRASAALKNSAFELMCPVTALPEDLVAQNRIVPCAWSLTPRTKVVELRRAFEDAFVSLFDRYAEDDIEKFLRSTRRLSDLISRPT